MLRPSALLRSFSALGKAVSKDSLYPSLSSASAFKVSSRSFRIKSAPRAVGGGVRIGRSNDVDKDSSSEPTPQAGGSGSGEPPAVISSSPVLYPEQPSDSDVDPNTSKYELQSRPEDVFKFKVIGQETQIVQIDLTPDQMIRAEPGSLVYMTEGIEMETAAVGNLSSGFARMLTGGSIMLTDFVYRGTEGHGRLVLSADYPSKIHPLRIDHYGPMICQKGAFLAGSPTIDITMEFAKKFGIGFFGGEGFVLQRLGGEGTALIKAGGALIKRELRPGEVLKVSTGSLVAFQPSVQYDIQMVKGFKNVIFGGEGLFLATLTGPGMVILQGLPFDRFVNAIAHRIPGGGSGGPFIPIFGGGGSSTGEGAGAGAGAAGAGAAAGSETASEMGSTPESPASEGDNMERDGWKWGGGDTEEGGNDDSGGGDDGEGGGGLFGTLGRLFGGSSED